MWDKKVKKLKRVTVRVRQLPCNCLVNLANGKLFIPCLEHQKDFTLAIDTSSIYRVLVKSVVNRFVGSKSKIFSK